MNNRKYWLDVIKALSIFLVIVLHTASYGVKDNYLNPSLIFYFSGVFAIPLFFMVNGYLLLDKQEKYKYAINKIRKIIVIAFLWNVPIVLISFVLKGKITNIFYNIFLNFIQKGYFWQFWFLGSLIIIYLFLPWLQKLYNNGKNYYKFFTLFLILLCLAINIYNIYNCSLGNGIIKNNVIQTYRIWTWLMYFCVGGSIHKNNLFEKISKQLHLIIMILCVISTVLYEYFASLKLYNSLFAENFYDSIIVILTSTIIFTFFRKVEIKRFKSIIFILSLLTMGVYIIHPSIINIIKHFYKMNNNYINILISIIVYFISLMVSYIILKIPKLNKTIKI